MQASDVPYEYMAARAISFKESTIQKAWEKSGIITDENGRPQCTPEIFTKDDFAPSFSSSTQLHLPDGFPFTIDDAGAICDTDPEQVSSNSGSDDDTDSDGNNLNDETIAPRPTRRSAHFRDTHNSGEDSDTSGSDSEVPAKCSESAQVHQLKAKAKKYQ